MIKVKRKSKVNSRLRGSKRDSSGGQKRAVGIRWSDRALLWWLWWALVANSLCPGQEKRAAMLAAILAGASPARGTCPVATVAISGDETGDQFIGSPEVTAPVGRAEMLGRIRQRGKQLDRS